MSEEQSKFDLLLDELRACRSQIDYLVRDVSDLKAQDKHLSQSLERFWADNWAPLKSDIQDIRNRLAHIEQRDVIDLERRLDTLEAELKVVKASKLSTRVSSLEKDIARRKGFAAAAGMLGGGGVAALLRWLLGGH